MNWDATKKEYKKAGAIVARARSRIGRQSSNLEMDIIATHRNGCPLDLDKFLNAKEFDFYHDVYGIIDHIDRRTGELMDCFLPRCARPSE